MALQIHTHTHTHIHRVFLSFLYKIQKIYIFMHFGFNN
jgi:hypothetical protein